VRWDEVLRFAASVRTGRVNRSLCPRQKPSGIVHD
jgi:hypothetical protein